MTTTAIAAPASVTISVRTLRRMLAAVLPHAAGASDIPLSVASFELSGGRLFLAATDRYTIGVARSSLPEAGESLVPDASVLMDAREAGELLAMLEGHAGESPVALAIAGGARLTAGLGHGRMAAWPASPADGYVRWRMLLHRSLTAPEPAELGDGFGLDPRLVARFGAGGEDARDGRREPLMFRLAPGRGSPLTLITRGDWFLGAIMPVARPADHAVFNWKSWAAEAAVMPDNDKITKGNR